MEKLNESNSYTDSCVLFFFFRHRIYSFHKTATDNSKISKLKDKIIKKGKILAKINIKDNNQILKKRLSNKENILVYNFNKSPEKNIITKKHSVNIKSNNQLNSISNMQNQVIKESAKGKYIIVGGKYEALRASLEKRGFVEETNPESTNFEFKFVLFTKTANIDTLLPYQLINHFRKNGALSRKVELMRNIRTLIYRGVDIDTFFPRCYDLSERVDFEDFLDDYKITKAMSVLKIFLKNVNKLNASQGMYTIPNISQILVSYNVLNDRKNKIKALLSDKQENMLDASFAVGKKIGSIHDEDWATIAQDEDIKLYTRELERLKKMGKIAGEYGSIKELSDKGLFLSNKEKSINQNQLDELVNMISGLFKEMKPYFPQFSLSGHDNIWIMKPSGLSRGRGIACIDSLGPALKNMKNNALFVIQKYIENPLLIKQRKFDIRQWVLITSVNPLIIWKFEEFYLRFSATDYSTDNLTDLFVHLTNNSITKNSQTEKEEEMKFKGNMYTRDQFINHLKLEYDRDIYSDILEEKINRVLKWTIECAKDIIEPRENSFEIFGFDLMIDEDFNVWLIEVNSSPAMDYSTEVTENVVKQGLEDLLKVVIDRKRVPNNEIEDVKTGKFSLIHKGNELPTSNTPNKELELKA